MAIETAAVVVGTCPDLTHPVGQHVHRVPVDESVIEHVGWKMCTDGRLEPRGADHGGMCPDCQPVFALTPLTDQQQPAAP